MQITKFFEVLRSISEFFNPMVTFGVEVYLISMAATGLLFSKNNQLPFDILDVSEL